MNSEDQNRQHRVLMIEGATFTVGFVTNFARELARCGKYQVDGLVFSNPTGRGVDLRREQIYQNQFHFPPHPRRPENPVQAMRAALTLSSPSQVPIATSGDPTGPTGYAWRKIFWQNLRSGLHDQIQGYDLYHWHCFLPEYLPMLDWFPQRSKIIITLWGSDLYRTAGIEEYRRQLRACKRASAFTMGSIEMKETFLAKFGWQFEPKVRIVTYGMDHLDRVDTARGSRDDFLTAHGIAPDKITVAIGHSGIAPVQHLRALAEVGKLSPDLRSRLTVLLPMTYGAQPDYLEAVRQAALRAGVAFHIFDTFLSAEDTARLRVACDVTIHVPISDQFSAAMLEVLLAGSVLITGAWLPYSRLRLSGCHYHEVGSLTDLALKLEGVLENLDRERAKAQVNAHIIRKLGDWDQVLPVWTALYDELLSAAPHD